MQISSISIDNQGYSKSFSVSHRAQNNEKKDNKAVYYSLIGLGVIAAGGIMYHRHKAAKTPNPIKVCTFQDLNQSLSAKEKKQLEEELQKLNLGTQFKNLKDTHQSDIFKRFVALLKMNPSRPVELPKIITTNAEESKALAIGEFFKDNFKFNTKDIEYTTPNELLLNLKNVPQNDKNTCITVKNSEKLFDDLKASKQFQEDFMDLLGKDQKKRIIIINNEPKSSPINEYNKIFLEYNN